MRTNGLGRGPWGIGLGSIFALSAASAMANITPIFGGTSDNRKKDIFSAHRAIGRSTYTPHQGVKEIARRKAKTQTSDSEQEKTDA